MKKYSCAVCIGTFPTHVNGHLAHSHHPSGGLICPNCLAHITVTEMMATGRAILYLKDIKEPWEVVDYFGVLRFPCNYSHVGKHNIAGEQKRFRFNGPDGYVWTGQQMGDNTIARCRRTLHVIEMLAIPMPKTVYFHHFKYEDTQGQAETGRDVSGGS